ncbi:MAG: carboxypeptidase regulatory-like domain-containing protein, partial [Pyrinomonadaceae bacterium]|nr:carboxypeptidase regulatory-like domain-containing protein [Pyrinomonadaceae bacterium]
MLVLLHAPGEATAQQPDAATHRIAGVVLDGAGAPVVGAQVSYVVGGSAIGIKTGEDGLFFFESNVADGVLRVRAPGFAPSDLQLRENGGGVGQLRIVLTPTLVAEAVTITATRTATPLGDTAASVRVLSSTDLA